MKSKIYYISLLFCLCFTPIFSYAQWQPTSGPFPQKIKKVQQTGTYLYALSDSSGVTRFTYSKNGGVTWKNVDATLNLFFKDFQMKGGMLFACNDTDVYKSNDHGLTWSHTDGNLKPLITQTTINGIFKCGGNICVTTKDGVYSTPDNGSQWSKLNQNWTTNVLSIVSNGDTIYVGTKNNGIYRSFDAGSNWQNFYAGLLQDVNTLFIYNGQIFAGTNTGLYYSLNNGVIWTLSNITDNISSFCTKGRDLFASCSNGGGVLKYNADITYTWNTINTSLANTEVNCLAVSDTFLYAATSDRVWKRPLSDIITRTINLSSLPANAGILTGSGTYPYGTSVTVIATPKFGYRYDNWLQNGSIFVHDSMFTFIALYEDYDLVAKFTLINDINNLNEFGFSLYPNPTKDEIILKSNLENLSNRNYVIYDVFGRIVKQGNLEENESHIDIRNLTEGCYFFEFGNISKNTYKIMKL